MPHGVVGMFDEVLDGVVRWMWYELEARFAVRAVRVVPWPHIGLVVARDRDRDAAAREVYTSGTSSTATRVHIETLVLFTGTSPMHPAVVRAAVREHRIDALHRTICDVVSLLVDGPSPYTATGRWNPHVTVATRDLTPELTGAVMAWLAADDPSPWVGTMDRLALIEEGAGGHCVVEEFALRA